MWSNYSRPQFLMFIILIDDNTVELFLRIMITVKVDSGYEAKCVVAYVKCFSFHLNVFYRVDNH